MNLFIDLQKNSNDGQAHEPRDGFSTARDCQVKKFYDKNGCGEWGLDLEDL